MQIAKSLLFMASLTAGDFDLGLNKNQNLPTCECVHIFSISVNVFNFTDWNSHFSCHISECWTSFESIIAPCISCHCYEHSNRSSRFKDWWKCNQVCLKIMIIVVTSQIGGREAVSYTAHFLCKSRAFEPYFLSKSNRGSWRKIIIEAYLIEIFPT